MRTTRVFMGMLMAALLISALAVGQTAKPSGTTSTKSGSATKTSAHKRTMKHAKRHYDAEIRMVNGKIRVRPDFHSLSKSAKDDICWTTSLTGTFSIAFDAEDGSPFATPGPYTVTSSTPGCPGAPRADAEEMTYSYHVTLTKEDGTTTKTDPAILVTN